MRQQVWVFTLPERVEAWQPKLLHWAGLIASGRADDFKETALLPDFLSDIFCGLLGYTRPVVPADTHTSHNSHNSHYHRHRPRRIAGPLHRFPRTPRRAGQQVRRRRAGSPKCPPLAQRTRSMWRRPDGTLHHIDGVSEPYNGGTRHAWCAAKSKIKQMDWDST
jgi:hypothetical protein